MYLLSSDGVLRVTEAIWEQVVNLHVLCYFRFQFSQCCALYICNWLYRQNIRLQKWFTFISMSFQTLGNPALHIEPKDIHGWKLTHLQFHQGCHFMISIMSTLSKLIDTFKLLIISCDVGRIYIWDHKQEPYLWNSAAIKPFLVAHSRILWSHRHSDSRYILRPLIIIIISTQRSIRLTYASLSKMNALG